MAINFNTSGSIKLANAEQLTINSNGNLKPTQPSFQGSFNGVTGLSANFVPYLNTTYSRNVVVNNAAASITVPTAGFYHIYAHQLITTTGYSAYLLVRINGGGVVHAYSDNDPSADMNMSTIRYLAANDVVSFYYQGTMTYSWGAPHSSVFLHLIG